MKKTFFILFLIAIWHLPAFPSSRYATTKDGIHIRADSTVSSYSFGHLSKNDKVKILEEKYDWYKIELPRKFNCYISTEFVKKITGDRIEVTGSNVNLRNDPSLKACIMGKAPQGAIFPVINETKQWTKIRGYPYMRGWVHKKLLKRTDENPDLYLYVENVIPKLSEPDIRKKTKLHRKLIEKGEKVMPLLEAHLPLADKNTSYSIILILTRLGQNNPELISYFLNKTNNTSIKLASIYLDVVQSLILPKNYKTAYFYLAEKGNLLPNDIKEARYLLEKKYMERINTQQN